LTHLTTFKHIQQELAKPGVIEFLLSQPQAEKIRATFMSMFALNESETGLRARQLASNESTAEQYILKPSLEGGGNNVYGKDIPPFLKSIPEETWPTFTLMKKIEAPTHEALLLSSEGLYGGPAISELGIFGSCLWHQGESIDAELLLNEQVGWTFKTKPSTIHEMSVVKGYGYVQEELLFGLHY
jgi:hypothetical protein